ncbi:hypothetical protein [Bremerella alba]|uniref:Uncharacterized protein n=1 Tax=Bremerella alba TaxID=980252 RepID=A0A7V8V7M6_9BACT|nr:hypothetical protein [Bremerella alba]MBA2116440.1 hypothetical protein [Bremerella alba]
MPDINPYESPRIAPGNTPTTTGEATLRVTRHWQYQDWLRAYQISVDGSPRDRIRTDQTISIPVTPGELIVVASIDWAKSTPVYVEAQPGDIIDLEVSGSLKGWKLLLVGYYSAFAPHQWLTLERI